MAQGYTASANPQRWKIFDNKLHLNYDADEQKKWEKNWPAALDK